MNKRGLSDVVTTLLIILVAVIAIGIIGGVVLRNVNTAGEQIDSANSNIRLSIDRRNAFVNPSLNYAKVVIKRESGAGEIKAFNVVVEDSQGKSFVKRYDQSIKELEAVPVEMYYSGLNGDIRKISVFPVFRTGSGKETFGQEAKRRIMLGTHVLSSGYYDQYYNKASQVRSVLIKDLQTQFFNKVDLFCRKKDAANVKKVTIKFKLN